MMDVCNTRQGSYMLMSKDFQPIDNKATSGCDDKEWEKIENTRRRSAEREVLRNDLFHIKLPFPWKLHQLLDDVEKDSKEDIVSWLADGRAFKVHKPKEFAENIMKQYFRQTKYNSFTRQLYIYGFSKLEGGQSQGAFYHPDFHKGNKERCLTIGRNKSGDRRLKKFQQHKSDQTRSLDCASSTTTTTKDDGDDEKRNKQRADVAALKPEAKTDPSSPSLPQKQLLSDERRQQQQEEARHPTFNFQHNASSTSYGANQAAASNRNSARTSSTMLEPIVSGWDATSIRQLSGAGLPANVFTLRNERATATALLPMTRSVGQEVPWQYKVDSSSGITGRQQQYHCSSSESTDGSDDDDDSLHQVQLPRIQVAAALAAMTESATQEGQQLRPVGVEDNATTLEGGRASLSATTAMVALDDNIAMWDLEPRTIEEMAADKDLPKYR